MPFLHQIFKPGWELFGFGDFAILIDGFEEAFGVDGFTRLGCEGVDEGVDLDLLVEETNILRSSTHCTEKEEAGPGNDAREKFPPEIPQRLKDVVDCEGAHVVSALLMLFASVAAVRSTGSEY